MSVDGTADSPTDPARLRELEREIARGSAQTAYAQLADEPDGVVAEVLGRLLPPHALRILDQFRERRREAVLAAGPRIAAPAVGDQRRASRPERRPPDGAPGRRLLPGDDDPRRGRRAARGGQDRLHLVHPRERCRRSPDRRRRDARDAARGSRPDPRGDHDPQTVHLAGQHAGRRRHARSRAAPLPGLSRLRRGRPTGGPRARRGPVPTARVPARGAGRKHGRRREGRAPGDALAARACGCATPGCS